MRYQLGNSNLHVSDKCKEEFKYENWNQVFFYIQIPARPLIEGVTWNILLNLSELHVFSLLNGDYNISFKEFL